MEKKEEKAKERKKKLAGTDDGESYQQLKASVIYLVYLILTVTMLLIMNDSTNVSEVTLPVQTMLMQGISPNINEVQDLKTL